MYLLFIYLFVCLFLSSPKDMHNEREREGKERERKRYIDDREEASHKCPDWRPNLQPRHVLWLEIEPMTFQFTGWCSKQLSHTSQGNVYLFRWSNDFWNPIDWFLNVIPSLYYWNKPNCAIMHYFYIAEFDLLLFCSEHLHLWEILACNFLTCKFFAKFW